MRNLVFAILIGFLGSCTISQEYVFKEDGAGTYRLKMDLSAAQSFGKGLKPEGEDEGSEELFDEDQKKEMDSTLNVLNNVEGITNAFMNEKDGIIEIGYDFKDINALNKSLESDFMGSSAGASGGKAKIEYSKKKFKMTSPDLSKEESLKEAEMMGTMITIETKVSFENKKIKKSKNPKALVSDDKKSIVLKYNLEELLKGEVSPDLDLKLK